MAGRNYNAFRSSNKIQKYAGNADFKAMNCPGCKKPMIAVELDQVEVDYCTSCRGIWLDRGELEILLQGFDQAGAFLDSFALVKDSKERKRKCPICSKRMFKVSCGEKEKVLADACPKKDGLWCDAGELQQMIRAADFQSDRKVFQLLKNMFQHPVP